MDGLIWDLKPKESSLVLDIEKVLNASIDSNPAVIVADGQFSDIALHVKAELNTLSDFVSDGEQGPAKMGSDISGNSWVSSMLRGDRVCWITPARCKELNLVSIPILLRR
jgi:hypothetical protein